VRTFAVTVLVLTMGLFVSLVLTEVVGIISFLWLDSDRASEMGIGKILWRVGFVCASGALIVAILLRCSSR
jgi:hypothetical protein